MGVNMQKATGEKPWTKKLKEKFHGWSGFQKAKITSGNNHRDRRLIENEYLFFCIILSQSHKKTTIIYHINISVRITKPNNSVLTIVWVITAKKKLSATNTANNRPALWRKIRIMARNKSTTPCNNGIHFA